MPAVSTPGYVAVDTAAEIIRFMPKAHAASAVASYATADMGMDVDMVAAAEDIEEPVGLMQLVDQAEDESDGEMEGVQADGDADMEEGDDETPVVSQQQLSNIFDVGPSFALPPIEEMFYQVADLVGQRPINV
jgi:NET1-associated nuclear protein 1 (U3 small nucleolar RNA-associated protein 17)